MTYCMQTKNIFLEFFFSQQVGGKKPLIFTKDKIGVNSFFVKIIEYVSKLAH